ncbi:hypothetical protein E3N88_02889 [Mikania micrantha]|uniref:1,3-beta-glucan synthase n=1 Tax=Mikania micrantha TaxID=192012 RepID=A0A5N6Q5G1_9ASTR|nr:hypothetical protein E3N88_02889 [Mikania micrantha]
MTSSGESSDSWDYLFQPSTEELLAPPPSPPPHRRILRKQNQGIIGEPAFDSEVVPSSLLEIAPILRVANEVEPSNPRVAYLCRYHAFMKSHKLDPTASGRGVLQFKTALLQRLERDNDPTLARRVKKSDVREMQSFYQDYYKKYIQSLQSSADKADSKQLSKAYRTASILFEVLKAINQAETVENEEEMLEAHAHHKVSQKTTEIYVPYNILPLDPDGANQAIMRFPEIQAAVVALRYTRGLPWQREYKRKKQDDILDWLQVMFGFQKDNVANQREHLILLLANVHIRQIPKPDQQPKLDDHALDDVMNKLLKNYKNWCKYLDKKSSLWLPIIQPEVQQRKLLYVSLYLLIWGEAANLRFMPECLCYIYHHMAFEMHGILVGNVSPVTGEDVKPAYGGDEEAFLKKVIYPIYEVIANEAAMSKIEKSKHSKWRNYDDLNEYFWSADCFRLGWPMSDAADFFCEPMKPQHFEKKGVKKPSGKVRWAGKVNFVEIRSYWHIFRSFDRMWRFFILCLQAMIIVAWNCDGNPTSIFDFDVFNKVMSVSITDSILKLSQAVLDIVLNWKARGCMSFHVKLRYVLKVASAATWVVVLTVTFSYTPLLLILVVIVYLSTYMLAPILFLFPFISHYLESSDQRILMLMMWWSQPRLYVGTRMHQSTFSIFKYTTFWILLIITKLAFSYYLEVKPLVSPTKAIMRDHIYTYTWHGFFAYERNRIGVVAALWAPIILVYFMDTQIWYAIFSTLFGGIFGAFSRLGEIQTLGMLRSRFQSLPGVVNACLISHQKTREGRKATFFRNSAAVFSNNERDVARFAQIWNKVITSFREEDLINNREMNLLLVPYCVDRDLDVTQWPLFLLAGKIHIALDMATNSNGYDRELKKRMENDNYMSCAVCECYSSFRNIIKFLVHGPRETMFINDIFSIIDKHVEEGNLMSKFKMSAFRILYHLIIKLMNCLLTNNQEDRDVVVMLFQNMLEVVTRDMMEDQFLNSGYYEGMDQQYQLFVHAGTIVFPTPESEIWKEKINRLYLLLTVRETAIDVPSNFEARRRLSFFSNSLFMDMPSAPKVQDMIPFSVLTAYYSEEVLFSLHALQVENEAGMSLLFYLQKIYPATDEWNNFLERMGCYGIDDLLGNNEIKDDLRLWASYREQTLTRTVRGMMYYRQALELQAFLDMAEDEDLKEGFKPTKLNEDQMKVKSARSLLAQCQAVADMKFTYVVSGQRYGFQKQSQDPQAQDVLRLLTEYPSLRVAYIDEVEERSRDATIKVYYSTLVKAMPNSYYKTVQNSEQVIYRIKLPGPAFLGVGKPENKNHAIIFTRGEGLQTIDMNQDNYIEEALKMRNLLQEFFTKHDDLRHPTILGLREHIFTGSVSSLASFISKQEPGLLTTNHRLLANPLRVRFHYGHPDVFDRLFHLTRGGVSKASRIINLNEDIFAGIYKLLRHTCDADCVDLKANYFFFICQDSILHSVKITVLIVYAFLYGRLYLVLSGVEQELNTLPAIQNNKSLQVVFASQAFVQIGFLMALPMMIELSLEQGWWTTLSKFIIMQINLAPMFSTFLLGTKIHYYGRTLLHGCALFRATGRGPVMFHTTFAENYRFYSRSHFVKGIELMILLIVYQISGESSKGSLSCILITVSIWFMVISWLFAPFVFNPFGFEWQKIVDDWSDWNMWINNQDGIGVYAERSWESWWEEEQQHLHHSGKLGVLLEIFLALRFLLYHYGLVYHLNIMKHGMSGLVCALSFVRVRRGDNFDLFFRLIKGVTICVSVLVILKALVDMTLQDIVVCFLAFIPAGWGLILIAQACKPVVKRAGLWGSVITLARGYEMAMGLVVFAPVAFIARFPFVSEFQTHMLFSQAFSRGLQISLILGSRGGKDQSARNV